MISALVLAAGTASRFGRTKQLEVVRGKPLAQHAVDTAADADVDELVIVLGHDAELVRNALRVPRRGRTIVNPAYRTGLASSLREGLRALAPESQAAVVLMADQPGIAVTHVRALIDAFRERSSPIVRLRFGNGPGPALLARATWAEVQALEGDEGARVLMERHPGVVEDVDVAGDAPVDVDEVADLDRA